MIAPSVCIRCTTSGNYGLVSLSPAESNKTIVTAVSRPGTKDESAGEQCLRYYYYLSVYEEMDWDQEIVVSIKSHTGSDSAIEIDRIGISEMIDNRWHSRNRTFNTCFVNYTVSCAFIHRET